MREEGQISAYQAMGYQVSIVLATAILFVPAITAQYARQDAWLSLVLAYLFGSLQVFVATKLALKFPRETVIQYAPRVAGKILGKVIGFIYIFYFFYVAYFVQREFEALMSAAYLPQTPIIVVIIMLTLLAAYVLYGGLEVLCRVNAIILAVALFGLLLIFLLIVKDIEFTRFLPFLENGVGPVVLGAVVPGGWFGETAVILMLLPFIGNQGKTLKTSLLAVTILFVVMEMVVIGAVGIMGPNETGRFLYPTFNIARRVTIEALPILERQDAMFMMIWVAGMLMKLSTFFYAGTLGLAQWLNLRSYRILILPAGAVMTALGMQAWENIVELKSFSGEVFPLTIIFVNFMLTGFLYLLTFLKPKSLQGAS
ncbi:MAG: endospore germination permease [Peptococcaceae bacterium]|nr:endospore germination permease [Peptococcaceae bacterium]